MGESGTRPMRAGARLRVILEALLVGMLPLNSMVRRTAPGFLGAWLLAAAAAGQSGEGLSRAARAAVEQSRTKIIVLKTLRENRVGSGTAFVVKSGLAVTARHTVESKVRIETWINGVSYPCRVQAVHPDLDVALIRLGISRLHLKPLDLAKSSSDLRAGEELVILAGFSPEPGNRSDPVHRNPIRAIHRGRNRVSMTGGRAGAVLELDASVERGDSGSPVLRAETGQVVGVLISRELPVPGGPSRTAYALPIELFRDWIDTALLDEDFYLLKGQPGTGR